MRHLNIEYDFYGQKIQTSIDLVEMVEQMPDAIKIETLIELFETLKGSEKLEPFQKVILKFKFRKLRRLVSI